jgi:hypothetical protein
MTNAARPLRRSGLSSRLLPDSYLVVVDEAKETALTLNPTGAAVWEFCDGEHSTEEIVLELAQLLSVADSAELSKGVVAIVDELSENGLLEFV